ncbi:uncharacterized protein LOC134833311 [Culicoides brevitarsis]|uniref:uncharacterized protein LOC134833311 n=1 Tax=Culicoides brevitarsis TaxID=469753 RepID=UPI00307C712C
MERWHLIFVVILQVSASVVVEINRACCAEDTKFMLLEGEATCVNRSSDAAALYYALDINCTSPAETVVVRNVTEIDDLDSLADYCYVDGVDNNQTGNDSYFIGYCQAPEWYSRIDNCLVPASIVALIAVFVVYVRIKTLRQPEDVAFLIFILLLILFLTLETVLEFIREFIHDASILLGMMFVKYYASLGSFVWINVVFVCQLRKNIASQNPPSTATLVWYHLCAWSTPILSLSVPYALGPDWFYYEYMYLVTLWIISCILLIFVVYFAFKYQYGIGARRQKVLRYRSILYLKLFLVSEFIWMFHSIYALLPFTIANYRETKIIFTIIDCIYALQGIYIFLVMVSSRLHVKKSLGGTKWCCWFLPPKWSEIDDAADVEPPTNDARRNSVGMSIYYT